MTDCCIIEKSGKAYGLLVREKRGMRFHATEAEVQGLNGRLFNTPQEAMKEVETRLRRAVEPPRLT